jgi:zinc protease
MPLRLSFFVVMFLWALGLPGAWAQTAPAALPAGVSAVTEVEGIREYRLANGLQLLLVPDSSKPTTTVNVTYRVGSRHENYGETGMAHLLEHLVFKGTPTTRNAFAEFTRRGLRANGTTSWDRTNYFASFAANDDNLRWYLGWQADVMVNSFIAKADLDTEMTVVRNEMEMGENNPGSVLFQRTLGAMYDWHNYGKSPIGARSDVENVDITRLQAFYRRHYQPDNATLIVAGRFDPAQVLAWVAQSFGPLPKPQRLLGPTYTLDAPQDGERSVYVRRVGGAPLVYMAYHLPPAAHPDFAAAALLAQLLSDAPSGLLHKRLVETKLAASVFGTALGNAEASAFFVGAGLAPGQDLDKARFEMAAALDAVAREPITAEALERARTQWLNAWEQGFTDPESVGVQLSSAIAKGDWRLFFLERNRIRQIQLADVQRVAAQWLLPDNRTVGLFTPTAQPQRAPAVQPLDVAAQLAGFKGDATVAAAENFEATPANLDARSQRFSLASGLRVGLVPKGTRGSAVQVRLALRFGDLESLRGQEAVASMMGALLDKGAAGLSRQQISDGFDRLRADVNMGVTGQTLSVSLNTTRQHLPATIALLGQVLRTATFPADALEETRSQWLAGIESQRKEPGALVDNALERHGNPYPKGDPRHAQTFDDLQAAVKAVTPAQVRAFHQRFISAASGEFSAVGDIDVAAVKAALEQALGNWARPAAGAVPFARVPRPLFVPPAVRLVIQTPDKSNAHLQAQLRLPLNDAHPDYAALMLADHMFGNGGSSRLWVRLREKGGFSYDVNSYVDWSQQDAHSVWTSTAIFAPQNQAQVEAAWREELTRSLQEGFTAEELAQARQGVLSARRLSRAQDAAVAAQLVNHLHLGRRFQVSQDTDDRLARATLDEVNAAWRKYIDPSRLVIAWGGDFKAP